MNNMQPFVGTWILILFRFSHLVSISHFSAQFWRITYVASQHNSFTRSGHALMPRHMPYLQSSLLHLTQFRRGSFKGKWLMLTFLLVELVVISKIATTKERQGQQAQAVSAR